jgi:hypothetical protein
MAAQLAAEARGGDSFTGRDLDNALKNPGFLVGVERDRIPVVVLDECQACPLRKPRAGPDRPLAYMARQTVARDVDAPN